MQGSIPQTVQQPAWRHQVERLQAHGQTAAHRYWQTYLDGLDAAGHAGLPLEVPHADGAHTPAPHEQALEALMLPAEITARLTRLSRVESVGLATVMLAAWGLLLCTCNAEPEVLFGYATSGRLPEPEHSGSPGGRINPLPLRLKITGDDRLGSWLREIQRHQLDHEAHGHLALADIQQCAGVCAEQLLFHNLVVVRHVTLDPLPWSGEGSLPFGAATPGTGQSRIPLTLVIFPGEHLKLELVYRRALFSAAAIQALLARLGQLLTRFARGGTQRLAWLSPSTEDEWDGAMSVASDASSKFKPASTGAGSL
jgi:non-ribosomal peptide synthetase component F